jgi:homoserine kinase
VTLVGVPVRVRVPATSANLGPGFDAFGLALALYDEVEVTASEAGLVVEVNGEGTGRLPLDAEHLVVRSLLAGLDSLGAGPADLTVRCTNAIPQGRGLGSSAAAIVAGVAAAYGLTGTPLDRDRILALAAEIEGHPDNVAACVYGGFTIAWSGGAVRLDPYPGLLAVAYVPPEPLSTETARGLLPDVVPHADAAANAGYAALLATALTTRPDLLPVATEDRLHQGYRASAMPDSAHLLRDLRALGAAAVVSGAGPTIVVPSVGADGLPEAPAGWRKLVLPVDPTGVTTEVATGITTRE